MSDRVIAVQIIGAPIACAAGVQDIWREVAKHTADQLIARFGDSVRVQYFDLFDADCPALPDGAQLPLVLSEVKTQNFASLLSPPPFASGWQRLACRAVHHAIRLRSTPIRSISTSTTSPGFRNSGGLRAKPTPLGVPVARMSPASSVRPRERISMIIGMVKIM